MSTATFDVQAVVGPDWIAARVDDPTVRIIEVDVSPAAFDAGHIPGAVFWNAYGDLRPVDYRPLPSSAFARLLAQSGIGPDTTVVFYGYGAYLGYWLMRSYGHSRVCLWAGRGSGGSRTALDGPPKCRRRPQPGIRSPRGGPT